MGLFILKRLLLTGLFFSAANSFASGTKPFVHTYKFPDHFISIYKNINDTTELNILKHGVKICSCQVLAIQSSTYRRQKNIGLFAEKTNGRSFTNDVNRINRVIEKEKKHMQSFFYDKLYVLNSFTEHTDCKSLYTKLKSRNKYLVLYDILDVDIRH